MFANLLFALAPGMDANDCFASTVVGFHGSGYAQNSQTSYQSPSVSLHRPASSLHSLGFRKIKGSDSLEASCTHGERAPSSGSGSSLPSLLPSSSKGSKRGAYDNVIQGSSTHHRL
ncbi:hypothetical protein MLD38_029800 [Melastoma candidum]|uniref:Uncharacterized protein n=1 Tax=Melastoma candidum TaxID=119954 RepID=A0ACB9N583_9MYRT|nr:hypothetical protein MLD38_029800 [Melastoma candidum]